MGDFKPRPLCGLRLFFRLSPPMSLPSSGEKENFCPPYFLFSFSPRNLAVMERKQGFYTSWVDCEENSEWRLGDVNLFLWEKCQLHANTNRLALVPPGGRMCRHCIFSFSLEQRRLSCKQNRFLSGIWISKGKVVPLQARCGPEGSRRFRLSDFHDIRHMKVVRSSTSRTGHLYPQKCSWHWFWLGAESTPQPWCGRKEICHWKIQWHHRESIPGPSDW